MGHAGRGITDLGKSERTPKARWAVVDFLVFIAIPYFLHVGLAFSEEF